MTPVTSHVCPGDGLSSVVNTMRRRRHSCALVVSRSQAVGIVTERDLVGVLDGALCEGQLRELPVRAVMSPEPICVRETDTLTDALTLARDHHLRHLPVNDTRGELVGVVTQTDMIHAYVQLLEQQAQLVSDNQLLHAQSLEDPLLGIGNRRAMDLELERQFALARRTARPYALALLDVDWFKRYNDHYGHIAGDRALLAAVSAVRFSMREQDSLYRYGGEELLLVLPNTDLEGAHKSADRARHELFTRELPHGYSPLSVLTLSAGVASGVDVSPVELIAAADRALYTAKEGGRNRVSLTGAEQQASVGPGAVPG